MDRRKLLTLKSISIYLESGFSLERALERSDKGMFQELQKGLNLSEVMRNAGFPEFVVQNIRLAEETGRLKEVLKNIIEIAENLEYMSRNLRLSIITPYLTLSFALFIFFFILTFVIPEMYATISELGVRTSGLTRFISEMGILMRENSLISFVLVVLLISSIGYAVFFQKIPIFNEFVISTVLKSLSLCLRSGFELYRTLELVYETTQAEHIKKELRKDMARLMRGKEPDFSFVMEFSEDIKKGFETGKLDVVLDKVSEIMQHRANVKAEMMRKLVEPIFFVVISILIIFIMVSMYVPLLREMIKVI